MTSNSDSGAAGRRTRPARPGAHPAPAAAYRHSLLLPMAIFLLLLLPDLAACVAEDQDGELGGRLLPASQRLGSAAVSDHACSAGHSPIITHHILSQRGLSHPCCIHSRAYALPLSAAR